MGEPNSLWLEKKSEIEIKKKDKPFFFFKEKQQDGRTRQNI